MKKSEDKCPEFLGRNGTGNNSWGTPDWLFAYLNKRFHFTLDPCADATNHKCKRYYTETDNGLFQDWFNERIYLNPPYGNELCKWVAKSAETQPDSWNNFSRFLPFIKRHRSHQTIVVAVIPARTCTIYFHEHIFDNPNAHISFLRGRIAFIDPVTLVADREAPAPAVIVVFGPSERILPRTLTVKEMKAEYNG